MNKWNVTPLLLCLFLASCGGGGGGDGDDSGGNAGGGNGEPPITPPDNGGGGNNEEPATIDVIGSWESNCQENIRLKIDDDVFVFMPEMDDTLTVLETIAYDANGNFFQQSVGYMDPSCLVPSGLVIELSGDYVIGNDVLPLSGMTAFEIDEYPNSLRVIGQNTGDTTTIVNFFKVQLNLVRREGDTLFYGDSSNPYVRPNELDFVNIYQLVN